MAVEKKFKLLNQIVVVHWKDATTVGGWNTRSAYLDHRPSSIVTVGFLLKKTKREITVVTTQDTSSGDYNQAISIPRSWVTSIRRVAGLDKRAGVVLRYRDSGKRPKAKAKWSPRGRNT